MRYDADSSAAVPPKKPAHTCTICQKPATSHCGGCKQIWYCSREHQRQDWKEHKPRCLTQRPSTVGTRAQPQQVPPSGADMSPAAWARGLAPDKQREWLVDCYRMRVDDDYAWGGGNLHGLYDPEYTAQSIAGDFLTFCLFAQKRGCIPHPWDWPAFLKTAAKLVPFAFEKSDAQEKYGSENVFNVMMGGRSLRATGEAVYARGVMEGQAAAFETEPSQKEREKDIELRAQVEEWVDEWEAATDDEKEEDEDEEEEHPGDAHSHTHKESEDPGARKRRFKALFAPVGGRELWESQFLSELTRLSSQTASFNTGGVQIPQPIQLWPFNGVHWQAFQRRVQDKGF
eukprot:g46328.t1